MQSNTYMVAGREFELQHYGVKGMKWGVRRRRNVFGNTDVKDGTYKSNQRVRKRVEKLTGVNTGGQYESNRRSYERLKKRTGMDHKLPNGSKKSRNLKTASAYGAIAVTSFLAAYGAKTIADARRSASTRMLEKTLEYVNAANRYYS